MLCHQKRKAQLSMKSIKIVVSLQPAKVFLGKIMVFIILNLLI